GCWSVGTNPTVVTAAMELTEYCDRAWFVALVPDSPQNLAGFFDPVLVSFNPTQGGHQLPQWSIDGWGYICWSELDRFCRDAPPESWANLRRNFDYNGPQIYVDQPYAADGVTPLTRERVEGFLSSLLPDQKALLRALAAAGGSLTQGELFDTLPNLARNS